MIYKGEKYLIVGTFLTYLERGKVAISQGQLNTLCRNAEGLFGVKITIEQKEKPTNKKKKDEPIIMTKKGTEMLGIQKDKVRKDDMVIAEYPDGTCDIVRWRKR